MSRTTKWIPLLLLVCCGCQQMRGIGDFGRNVVGRFTGNTPLRSALRMEASDLPDERRQGINMLADRDFGRRPPYTDRYLQIAQLDPNHLVRATAIRALNRSRDDRATAVFIKAMEDVNPLVRQEAAKALANIPDPAAVPALLRSVNNPQESRDVRIAAADALKHYRSLEVARALVGTLGGREFGVAWQSRRSLVRLTGQDLRYNETEWLQYLAGPDRPFG
jgi:HEAT repeat protein